MLKIFEILNFLAKIPEFLKEFWPNSDVKSSKGSIPRRSNLSTLRQKIDADLLMKQRAALANLEEESPSTLLLRKEAEDSVVQEELELTRRKVHWVANKDLS